MGNEMGFQQFDSTKQLYLSSNLPFKNIRKLLTIGGYTLLLQILYY